jgi:hypothetical protein
MTDDIEQIRLLKARYFRLLDTKQWDEWKDCFTEDLAITVEMTRGEPGKPGEVLKQAQGREGFVAALRVTLAEAPTVHHGHMPEITLTGPDTATGIWAMADIVAFPGSPVMYGYGHYNEHYRKEGGRWRIARLHLTRLKVDYRDE